MFNYKTSGVCASEINIDVENDVIKDVEFVRGCPGNLFGISVLVKGMKVDDAIEKLAGVDCRGKGTSCPDQLAKALVAMKESK